jgi:hypothetical protein
MGRLDVGVLACRELVPDPWKIADHFTESVRELETLAEKLEGTFENGNTQASTA